MDIIILPVLSACKHCHFGARIGRGPTGTLARVYSMAFEHYVVAAYILLVVIGSGSDIDSR